MREPESIRSSIEAAASDPKVATLVATGSASAGAMVKLDIIQGIFGTASVVIGSLTALVVLAIQTIKLVRVYRAWNPNQPEPKE